MVQPPNVSLEDSRPQNDRERKRRRETWLRDRKFSIGASDAAAACGLSRYRAPWDLWADKVSYGTNAEDTGEAFDESVNEAIYWGNKLEPHIRAKAKERLGHVYHPGRYKIFRHPEYRMLTATLDGRIAEPTDAVMDLFEGFPTKSMELVKGHGLLEIKTSGNAAEWGESPDSYPVEYMAQVQHAMNVTGFTWGVLACLMGGFGGNRVRYYPFVRVPEFISALQAKELSFWNSHVSTRIPPDITKENLGSQIDSIRAKFAAEIQGKVIELEPEYDMVDEVKQHASRVRRQASVVEDYCQAVLMTRLGDCEIGILQNGAAYHFKTVERKEYVVKASSTRRLTRTTNKKKIEAAREKIEDVPEIQKFQVSTPRQISSDKPQREEAAV